MTNPFARLCRTLESKSVRYVLMGVAGANLYAPGPGASFLTRDYDLFLPLDPDNLVRAWAACEDDGLDLWLLNEPLDRPRDRWLAERIVARQAMTRATGPLDLEVDLSLVMTGFDFETVWAQRRAFVVERVEVPTARLLHIVTSKQAAGRDKDKLFLAAHREALEQLLKKPGGD